MKKSNQNKKMLEELRSELNDNHYFVIFPIDLLSGAEHVLNDIRQRCGWAGWVVRGDILKKEIEDAKPKK